MLSGALTYAYLAVVARSVPTAEYGWFGAYWSVVLVIGFGAFLPVELELTRLVHLRPAGGGLPPGTLPAVGAVTAATLVAVGVGWPLLSPALGGHTGLLWALVAVCLVSAVQFLLRGLLLGSGRIVWHGSVLLVDSALRVAGAVVVAAVGSAPTAVPFGWTLVVAIGLAHAPVLAVLLLRDRRSAAGREPAAGTRLRLPALGHLVVATLAAQALLNAAPVVVTRAAAPAQHGLAAAFVASFTLVRLPLFVAVPLQSTLLPALTEAAATADRRTHRTAVLRAVAVVGAGSALAAVVGAAAGPAVVRLVFGARYALPAADLALLSAGSVLYLGLLLVTQALVASSRHRDSALAWVAGLLVGAVLVVLVPGLVTGVALAFPGGSAAGLLVGTAALLRRHAPAGHPERSSR